MQLFTKLALLFSFLLFLGLDAAAQRVLTGTVRELSNEPLIGASVVVATPPGQPVRGTITDENGAFSLVLLSTDKQVKVSFTGFEAQTLDIPASNVLEIILSAGSMLSEMVVIGYGEVKREDLTGSVVSVGAKDFQRGNISSPEQLIAGKIAGVSVIGNSGIPGAGSQIRIRGGSSLNASNDPLIVLDGVPLDNEGIKGASNPLGMINPNDIETFTVLKDASATAIYGSRASNGVIIITTKRGSAGKKMQVNFSSVTSIAQPVSFVDLLDTAAFRKIVRENAPDNQQGLVGTAQTDWQDEIFRTAISQDYNLTLTGGGKVLPFRASVGFLDQNGIVLRSNLKRYSAGIGLSPTLLSGQLRFNINVKASLSQNVFANDGAIGAALSFDPTQSVYDDSSKFKGFYEWQSASGNILVLAPKNPVGLLKAKDDYSNILRSVGNISTDYRFPFLPELRANLNLGYDVSQSDGTTYIDSLAAAGFTGKGTDNEYSQNKQNLLLDFYLNYAKDLKFLDSRVDLTAGYSYQDFIREDTSVDRNLRGVVNQSLYFKTQNTLISFFGRVNYDIGNKYLITGTLRNDGSSRFSPETRWGLFPAAAVAWRINREGFVRESKVISDLKLRAGWGITGQQAVTNDYPYLARYTLSEPTAQYPLGNTYYNTYRPEGYDAKIKWEETTTSNIGLDFGFNQQRFTGNLDFYLRETRDLLATVPVPAGSNLTNQILTNVGTLENKGVELTLGYDVIRTRKATWNVAINGAYNINTIKKLQLVTDPNFQGIVSGDIGGGVGNKAQINSVGYARSTFFLYEQLYDENGKPIEGSYADTNNDGKFNLDDRVRAFQADPKFFAGLSTSVNYLRWSFGLVARGSFGQHVYNNPAASQGALQNVSNSTKFLSNLNASVLNTNFQKNQFFSNYYVEKADFIRLDNISAGYQFKPINNRFLIGITVNVQNAFVFTEYTGVDPEIANGIDNNFYPRPRTYSIGVNLTY